MMQTQSYTRQRTSTQSRDFTKFVNVLKLSLIYGSQHSQKPKKYKKQKLRNKMEVNTRLEAATARLKQVKRQRNRVDK